MIEAPEFGEMPWWPNCQTPDCENKACTWSDRPEICFPCGERVLGRDAMIARFNATHDEPWTEPEMGGS